MKNLENKTTRKSVIEFLDAKLPVESISDKDMFVFFNNVTKKIILSHDHASIPANFKEILRIEAGKKWYTDIEAEVFNATYLDILEKFDLDVEPDFNKEAVYKTVSEKLGDEELYANMEAREHTILMAVKSI